MPNARIMLASHGSCRITLVMHVRARIQLHVPCKTSFSATFPCRRAATVHLEQPAGRTPRRKSITGAVRRPPLITGKHMEPSGLRPQSALANHLTGSYEKAAARHLPRRRLHTLRAVLRSCRPSARRRTADGCTPGIPRAPWGRSPRGRSCGRPKSRRPRG